MAESMPFQPSLGYKFPNREFGEKSRYQSIARHQDFMNFLSCIIMIRCTVMCKEAITERLIMSSNKPNVSFITKGYFIWKDAKVAFRKKILPTTMKH